jgi:predicted ATPase
LLLAAGADRAAAAACFEDALACARAQDARALELRAALSLARLHRDRRDHGAALEALRGVYADFDEGFDTLDLVEARQLLGTP